ncbi:hypothetical protein WQ57_21150 [Mesobacillus campisalis]|uniref:Uncharacterized protein n=1 Tax=Mesobacillus campisalis TaxID=1408103 RepID=A0A0M2SN93_9BACI|nr:hypothetical protein WQ57_21150 [Mesobacillus campisalis]
MGSLILLLMSLVLAGCGEDSHVKQFYSSGEGKYKIFAAGIEDFEDTQLSSEPYSNKIESVYIAASMEVVERDFEYLDIKESPAFANGCVDPGGINRPFY